MAFKNPKLGLKELAAKKKLKSAMKGMRTKMTDGKVMESGVPPMVDKKEIMDKTKESEKFKNIKKKFRENKRKYGK